VSPAIALPLFGASALLTFVAAGFFADKLDHVGPRLGLPEAAVGLLTAVAADTPEISSAVVALVAGKKETSLGVVLGSNVFNLAAMIGLSAVAAGAVTIARRALKVEGITSLLALLVTGALVLGVLPAWLACVLLVGILGPYLVVTLRSPHAHGDRRAHHHHPGGEAIWKPIALIVPAVALIVIGSTGMVKAALALASRWHVSQAVTGLLVLAVLTSLPNAFTAVRLGLAGSGDALVTETLASNTINLTGGLLLPALFVGIASSTGRVDFDLAWLAAMTLIALAVLIPRRGAGRLAGGMLIVLYLVFVVVHIAVV
jgi:cation:H+ antiporter